ncbi:MAG: radical SAM protein [Gudongella sp.]|nr:radical SAM protein [Gudongella sp.]
MDINDIVHYPHDEMTTFMLPITLGCAYNKCAFCSMYKDIQYRRVPISEIEPQLMNGYLYTEKVFLTGADPLTIGFDEMVQILRLIKKYLPYCARVACYASIRIVLKYSEEQLSILHNEGLRLLYIGFETGSDDVLELMNKPHKVVDAITAAKKLNRAQLMFNTIIMYGIAGKGEAVSNAIATSKMINQFHTNSIITMNLTIFEGTTLNDMVKNGEFIIPDRNERLLEIKSLLENLEPIKPTIFDTTHPTNIIKIKGTLPQEKEKLIKAINI